MRHLKTYGLFESKTGLTKSQENFLNRYTKGTWTYNPSTGLVDVKGGFDCSGGGTIKTFNGVKFGKISGNFWCSRNKLTTLEGGPQEVGGHFDCDSNQLTILEGAPQKVGGSFDCSDNELISLEGGPQEVGWNFNCSYNQLTSLEGAPQKVGRRFVCDAFRLGGGEWNLKGWLKVLKEGSPEAQKLIHTILSADELNKEIAKDPAGMIMKLKKIWNDENFREIKSKLVWPKGYADDADLVGDLDDVGF